MGIRMKFKITYKQKTENVIVKCENLNEAEILANKSYKSWSDIIYLDKYQAKIAKVGYE